MAKVKLNLTPAPETFNHPVTLILPSGDEAELNVEYIYRTKQEFAAWIDTHLESQKSLNDGAGKAKSTKAAGELNVDKTMLQVVTEQIAVDAKSLFEIAKGWDLEESFTVENIERFENKYPGVIQAIGAAYRDALYGIRLKN